MDDSGQDFEDPCSKLLKRNRKNTVDPRELKTCPQQSSSQTTLGKKGKKKVCKDDNAEPHTSSATSGTRVKDQALLNMRKFRRASPPRMMLGDQGIQEECQRPIHPGAVDSDEALAMRLQQELDRDTRAVDLEDEGLFFCQLCNKNLSHMTPDGRTQHINRCLDEEEHIAPAPAPGIMECPICGKRFKSEKNRASHMKRCSSDMGVPPAVLMQALQRQAEETHSSSATNTQTAGQKRKGSKSNMPASKKPRKKPGHMDEDTMMAIALSSSLLEQEKQLNLQDATAPSTSKSPALKWNADAGKGRSKKKRGANARPLPLLLVQDPGAAAAKIQERVSTLLLCTRAPSPPAPTRCTSTLSGQSGAAPLWQKSALLSGLRPTDFYVPALLDIVAPQESSTTVVSGEVAATPILKSRTSCASIVPSQMGCSSPLSTPGPGRQIPGGSQALQDLMDLAEDGMTLTQYGYSTTELTKDQQSGKKHISRLHSFVVEKEEELSNDHVSGFLPETVDDDHKEQREEEEARQKTRLLARLAVDLGSMVNNPQLSDVQLQVDSGEVYFAHSFMVYARCPLLAEMMHESGFGVQEEGVPAAQRVLLNDVPGPAVLALLQFLYTAKCSVPPSLRPYILELASRFDLKDLQDFCRLPETVFESGDCERLITHTDKDFAELLRSMWHEEDPEDADHHSLDDSKEMEDHPGDICSGDGEIQEDKVNEDELEEIYEFAATQKKREEENEADSGDPPEISTSPPKIHDANTENVVNTSLDRSYSRLFSETWGDFEEKPEQKSHLPARLVSSEMSARTLLQSSASVIDKLSPTPPPNAQNLPVPGVSPALSPVAHWGEGDRAEEILKKSKIQDAETIFKCVSSPLKKPELVFLSDSSDDMCVDLTQSSNSPLSQNEKSFTAIKVPHTPNTNDLNTDKADDKAPEGEISPEDCSGELSWLIPSTPLQPGKSVRTSSSQIKSNICRTQLFPKQDDSMSKSLSCKASFSTSVTSHQKSSLDLTREKKLDSSGFAVPQSTSKHSSNTQTKQNTPIPFPAYCSTPVQTVTSKVTPASPFSVENIASNPMNTEISPSPEKVQSFHLSPLSEQSSSHSKSSIKSKISEDCNTRSGVGSENSSLEKNNQDCLNAEGENSCLGQSFMDEPPMAFNDSWGLDACAENPCFSLKLDDSEGSDQQQRSLENIKMATPQSMNAGISSSASPHRMSTETSVILPPEIEAPQDVNNILMDSKVWDSWDDEDEKDTFPSLSERLKPPVQYKTPISKFKNRQSLVPITPLPHYSDMDTPELKNKLNKFGVRPLPKRQMVLKLKEIHQYTHQLVSSDSEDEAPSAGQTIPAAVRQTSCAIPKFKKPSAVTTSPLKQPTEDEPLSASQGSNTSSTAESERSNPEIVQLSDGDSDSDGGVSASQSASRLQDRLQAVRTFIMSDSSLYNKILQYQPLVLTQLQQQLKTAGIRLGVSKLADYLDSQCITFTTAKPGQSAPSRRRVKKNKGETAVRRKKNTAAAH
ncbi:unnamed protein product [Knipowitschia caucasica]